MATLPEAVTRLQSWDTLESGPMKRKPAAPWKLHNILASTEKPSSAQSVHGVDGALLFESVLSQDECKSIISATEQMGFSTGEDVVSVPLSVRQNDAVAFVVEDCMRRELSRRLQASLPKQGSEDAVLSSLPVNGLWRCYRYAEPSSEGEAQCFTRHFDGSQLETEGHDGMTNETMDRATGKPRCRSQMSLLLYLNDGFVGGETVFYDQLFKPGSDPNLPPGSDDPDGPAVLAAVAPSSGTVLAFWHGHHPLSLLHEGSPLRPTAVNGVPRCKYVVRTDLLYQAPEEASFDHEWTSNSSVQAMLWAAARS